MRESERSHHSIWLQGFARFKTWTIARPRLLSLAGQTVLFAVLLIPSIWMLSVIPPLWRDVDAYVQLTRPPGFETILQYGPLYCFVARVPLYLGYSIDCFSAGGRLPTLRFFLHPILTDSGVYALVISQHIGLFCSTFYLITLVTRLFWVRLTLAIAWAANPLFYSFAHCVGGETLSLILTLLIAATGLRIIRYSDKVPAKEWLLFGVLLWLCILTRHINAALASLLPLTFFILGAYRLMMTRLGRSRLLRRWQGFRARRAVRKAILGVAVGTCCVLFANASLRMLSYATQTPYHSVVGFPFLFRLKFLAGLPSEERNQLLDEVSKNTDSGDVRKLISFLRTEFSDKTPNWDVGASKKRIQISLFPEPTDASEQAFYGVLNRTASAFLYPPKRTFLNAVATDFKRSQRITIPDVVSFLFVTTRFYFSHRDAMPQCASLVTFRNKGADEIFAVFKKHSYFRHPKNLSYRALLFLWLFSLVLLAAISKMRKQKAASAASYAVALTALGLLMMLASCFLTIFQPRYTLPMWELTIVSLVILSGGIMDSLLCPSRRPHSLKPKEQTRYSEQMRES